MKCTLHLASLVLCAVPLLAASAPAADDDASAANVSGAGVNASRAVMDKDSKRLRAPERDEPMPGSAAAAAGARSAAPQSMLRSPNASRFQQQQIFGKDGTETMRLDLRQSLRFTVARRDAEGKLTKDCVVGEDAVAQRMTQATPVAPLAKGGSHE